MKRTGEHKLQEQVLEILNTFQIFKVEKSNKELKLLDLPEDTKLQDSFQNVQKIITDDI